MPGIADETRQLWQASRDQHDPDPEVRIAAGMAALKLAMEGGSPAIQAKAAELLAGLTPFRVVAVGDHGTPGAGTVFAEAAAR